MRVNRNKAYISIEYKGETFYLCCPLCQGEFEKNPEKYIKSAKGKHTNVR
ncbi:MAG: YHS domain-containing protein [bacterium]